MSTALAAAAFEAQLKGEGLFSDIEGVEVVVSPSDLLVESTLVVSAKSVRPLTQEEDLTVSEVLLGVAETFTYKKVTYEIDIDTCIVEQAAG